MPELKLRMTLAILMAGFGGLVAGCDSGTAGSGTPSTSAAIKQDLHDAGADVVDAGKRAGVAIKDEAVDLKNKASPALNAAGEKIRDTVHDAANKVADKTATQPDATAPK